MSSLGRRTSNTANDIASLGSKKTLKKLRRKLQTPTKRSTI